MRLDSLAAGSVLDAVSAGDGHLRRRGPLVRGRTQGLAALPRRRGPARCHAAGELLRMLGNTLLKHSKTSKRAGGGSTF